MVRVLATDSGPDRLDYLEHGRVAESATRVARCRHDDERHIGLGDRTRHIERRREQRPARTDQLLKLGLVDRRCAVVDRVDVVATQIGTDDAESLAGKHGGERGTQLAETDNRNPHPCEDKRLKARGQCSSETGFDGIVSDRRWESGLSAPRLARPQSIGFVTIGTHARATSAILRHRSARASTLTKSKGGNTSSSLTFPPLRSSSAGPGSASWRLGAAWGQTRSTSRAPAHM